jgi:hypothetical protein
MQARGQRIGESGVGQKSSYVIEKKEVMRMEKRNGLWLTDEVGCGSYLRS